MKADPLTHAIPIRLDKELKTRVFAAAKRLGTPRSTVIRMAILATVHQIEAGYIRIPEATAKRA